MEKSKLISEIKTKKTFLCIGLDTDINKIPKHLLEKEDPIFEFNKAIIDTTHSYCVAYKPNVAFYESLGPKGWEALKKTIDYISEDKLVIADAKRGDIGNTSKYYAKTFFEYLNADAITIAPYMGEDSVTPFLEYKNKWVILLALTSNKGALDFQFHTNLMGEKLYKTVLKKSSRWGNEENMMYVVGATRAEGIGKVRKIVPHHFFLVPGLGTQGGSLEETVKYGWNEECGLLVNSSRGIIYASDGEDFALKAGEKAKEIQKQMQAILLNKKFI